MGFAPAGSTLASRRPVNPGHARKGAVPFPHTPRERCTGSGYYPRHMPRTTNRRPRQRHPDLTTAWVPLPRRIPWLPLERAGQGDTRGLGVTRWGWSGGWNAPWPRCQAHAPPTLGHRENARGEHPLAEIAEDGGGEADVREGGLSAYAYRALPNTNPHQTPPSLPHRERGLGGEPG